MIDVTTLLEKVNIAQVIEADLGPARKKSGKWLLWSCPFHPDGKTPSLAVTPVNGRWYCFGCGKSGDAITWLREREGLTFQEACERLGAGALAPISPRPIAPRPAQEPQDGPPSAVWQERARQVIAQGEVALWGSGGEKALAWLRARGLRDGTIRAARLGYNPAERFDKLAAWGLPDPGDGKRHAVFLPRGVIIPCEVAGVVWRVRLRRPVGKPKYWNVLGSKRGLYLAETLTPGKPAVLAEGEFDSLLLYQEAGDLVGVVTLGSVDRNLPDCWVPFLLPIPTILVAYDTDGAGESGASAWASLTARARRIKPLVGKDITDFWKAGGNLRAWVSFHLAALANEAPPEPCPSTPATIRLLEQEIAASMDALHAAGERGDLQEAEATDAATAEKIERLTALYDEALPTVQAVKTAPALPEIPPAALGVAWRVAGRAPGIFTSPAQVEALGRQLTAFAGAVPIMGLPVGAGSTEPEPLAVGV